LGKRYEYEALLVAAVWKAFAFGLLVFAFHFLEEVIKRLIHGADIAKASTIYVSNFRTTSRAQHHRILRFLSSVRMARISTGDG